MLKIDITPRMIQAGIAPHGRHYVSVVPVVDDTGPSKMIINYSIENIAQPRSAQVGSFSATHRLQLFNLNDIMKEIIKDALYELIQQRASSARDKTSIYKDLK